MDDYMCGTDLPCRATEEKDEFNVESNDLTLFSFARQIYIKCDVLLPLIV